MNFPFDGHIRREEIKKILVKEYGLSELDMRDKVFMLAKRGSNGMTEIHYGSGMHTLILSVPIKGETTKHEKE